MNFKSGDFVIRVLQNFNVGIKAGEKVALVGASGTGKSTVLQISALLARPTSGSVFVHGNDANNLSDNEKTRIRRESIGFVYQSHNLLQDFSAMENVVIPQLIKKVSRENAESRAKDLLHAVGLSHRLHHKPTQLSGGEQQRVAISRALINNPSLIIADEPTGNLDAKTADVIFDLFLDLADNFGVAIFMATHNMSMAKLMDTIVVPRAE
jgi:lipoprotein-releasing system ATP-binding protein